MSRFGRREDGRHGTLLVPDGYPDLIEWWWR